MDIALITDVTGLPEQLKGQDLVIFNRHCLLERQNKALRGTTPALHLRLHFHYIGRINYFFSPNTLISPQIMI